MIDRLDGEFLEIGSSHLLMNLGGLGIRVQVPRSVADRFRDASSGTVYTRLLVRDGEPQLYGFAESRERDCFDSLIAVNGVGARIGLGVLSFMDPSTLAMEVERGSVDQLITVPGVGRKLANRIVLELKGRLPISVEETEQESGKSASALPDGAAVQALTALGYPLREATDAVRRVFRESGSEPPPLDELVRRALTSMSRTGR